MHAPRVSWIDWMKSLGMLLIVLGHTGANSLAPTPPFNFKQLGVAFFVFVMGFSLSRENRSSWRVLYNRLFEVYFFGGVFAILLSGIAWMRVGDLLESNYLPLLGGINVVLDNFPANPTTWYIGTYLHLLLLWAVLLRRWRLKPWMLVFSLIMEVPVRAALIQLAGNYVAYMLLTNWATLFLLGFWVGQRLEEAPSRGLVVSWKGALLAGSGLIFLLISWAPSVRAAGGVTSSFPFQFFTFGNQPAVNLLVTSAAVSLLYVTFTLLSFQICRALPASRVVEFFARNTLIIFIIHMPLVYALSPTVYGWLKSAPMRTLANVVLYYVLPACGSEILHAVLRPRRLRDYFASLLFGRRLHPVVNN